MASTRRPHTAAERAPRRLRSGTRPRTPPAAPAPPAATSPGTPMSRRRRSPSCWAGNGRDGSRRVRPKPYASAASALGYRPNLAARSLRLGRTRTALLVVPALTHDYFAWVYAGASRAAAEHDFGVVLYPSPEGTGPAVDPFGSARAALDGVIASSMAPEALAALRDGGQLPLVMLDSDPQGDRAAATVNLDIADGMRQVSRPSARPRPPAYRPYRGGRGHLDLRRTRATHSRRPSPTARGASWVPNRPH